MTIRDFRKNETLRVAMRTLLSGTVLPQAIAAIKESHLPRRALSYKTTDPAFSVAMTHAFQAGAQEALRALESLQEPVPEATKTPTELSHIQSIEDIEEAIRLGDEPESH